jgi:8-oxo-dGTP pyrophosphatase MutT (NUDIX family)
MYSINQIKQILKNRNPKLIEDMEDHYIHAAVLIPLFMENGSYKVLFTERTHKVEHHKGQISFPGGVVEEHDQSLEETALRESYEEIGLLTQDVEILGRVDDTHTVVSNFIVHPFVGMIPYPYQFEVNTDEVESIITIPLHVFLDRHSKYRKNSLEVEGFTFHGAVYEYDGTTIWGATARIMQNFIRIIRGKLSLPEIGE